MVLALTVGNRRHDRWAVRHLARRKAKTKCVVCHKLVTVLYMKNHMDRAHGIKDFKPSRDGKLVDMDQEDEEEDEEEEVDFGTFEENNPELANDEKRAKRKRACISPETKAKKTKKD